MMEASKTLILVRHAKSSWDHPGLRDHDRPLNPRGIRDAPRMAQRLASRGQAPDRIVTSSAVRALATAQVFADELGLGAGLLAVRRDLYGAAATEVLEIVRGLDARDESVMLVGHNPTFTELANGLAPGGIGHLPTCSVVTLGLDLDRWTGAGWERFRLVHFDFPKKDRD